MPKLKGTVCLSACCLASALAAAGLAAYVASELVRFTPTWEPITCVNLDTPNATVINDQPNWLNLTEEASMRCDNPNPYPIHIVFYKQGEVFVNWTEDDGNFTSTFLIPLGWSEHNKAVFAAEGSGVQSTWTHAALPWLEGMTIVAAGPSPVVHKIYMKQSLMITLYGMEIEAGKEEEAWCGYTYEFITGEKGDTRCVSTLEELVVPAIDYVAPPTVIDLSDEDKDRLESVRLLAIILPLIFLVLLSSCCCAGAVVSLLKGGGKPVAKATPPVLVVEEQQPPVSVVEEQRPPASVVEEQTPPVLVIEAQQVAVV